MDPSEVFKPLPRVLVLLAGFIALIEIVLSLADAGVLADTTLRLRVFNSGAFWTGLLHGGRPLFAAQPWTMFISHAFLHGSFLHMAMNLAVLLGLGRFTADRYGPRAILPVFLAGAVAGGAIFGMLSSGRAPMVGASGAVFAFLGVWTVWDWQRHVVNGASLRPVLQRIGGLVVVNAILFFGLGGMLAWEAHLGGFLAGMACGWWLQRGEARLARSARADARRRPEG